MDKEAQQLINKINAITGLFESYYSKAEFVGDKMQIIDDAFAKLTSLIFKIGLLANNDRQGAITVGIVLRESMKSVELYKEVLEGMPLLPPPSYLQ